MPQPRWPAADRDLRRCWPSFRSCSSSRSCAAMSRSRRPTRRLAGRTTRSPGPPAHSPCCTATSPMERRGAWPRRRPSRSALAEHFSRTSGMAPMHYLAQWRMQVAAQKLRTPAPPWRRSSKWSAMTRMRRSRAFSKRRSAARRRRGGAPTFRTVADARLAVLRGAPEGSTRALPTAHAIRLWPPCPLALPLRHMPCGDCYKNVDASWCTAGARCSINSCIHVSTAVWD
jgi:hypothetical protein